MKIDMKDLTNNVKRNAFRKVILFMVCSLVATGLLAKGPAKQPQAPKNHKYKIATGADQVLSAVYDPTTNTLRVSGGGSGGGTVTNIGLSMPSTFSVAGGPVTSSGTLSVNWAQPVAIVNGGTGQTSAPSAFNALAPPTAAGGLIYGTGTNTYSNLSLGLSGQCLGSNGTTLAWTTCGSGSTLTLGGDLSGTSTSQTVIGLQSHPVSASAPAGGQVLEWSSSANAWTPTALPAFGTVSSVGLALPSIFNLVGSPITTSGTLTVGLATEAANTFFAGPASGTAGAPAFRALAGADIPATNLSATGNGGITGVLGVVNGGTGLSSVGSNGQCLASNGTSLVWTNCSAGSVTSVGLSLPSGFGATGSPVTTSGTLGISMPSGWGAGSLLVGNGANSVATLAPGASGQCLTSSGVGLIWGSCGTAGTSTTFQVNGANAAAQSTINFQNGGYITISNPSAGNIQFNFNGPLGIANGGTGLTALGTSGQCLGSNGTAMVWQACGAGSSGTVTSVGLTAPTGFTTSGSPVSTTGALTLGMPSGWTTGSLLLGNGANSVAPLGIGTNGQCLTSTGITAVWGSCGAGSGGGLPSSWTTGSNNAVTAAPTASTDTTPLTVASALSSGGSADIFDVCQTSPCTTTNKFFWVTWNGNLGFQASNLQLSTNGPAPFLYLNGINGNPGQPYLKTATAALNAPSCPVSASATGGTVAAGTYYFKCTWVNPAGETLASAETRVTTTGSTSAITLTAPGAQYSAFGYQIYVSTSPGNEQRDIPTSAICTLAAQAFGGNAVCASTSNAIFTTTPAGSALAPPTTNTTGGAYIAAFAPAADGLGMFLTSGAAGADAPLDSGLVLPGGTGVNLTAGSTTTANALACLSASNTVSQCAANAANTIIGVFASSGQNSLVQTTGIATVNLAASATTTANDFACSNATAGTIVDNGAAPCASGQQVGIIAQTNSAAVSSVPVLLRFVGSGGSGGSGTVTSVGLVVPTGFSTSGSPVTTAGTLTIGMPSGWATGSLLLGNGANSAASLALGASGQCLTSNGATAAWGTCGGGSSNTFQVNGTNLTSSATINWLSGGPIAVTNTSAGNVQFTCPSCLVNNPAATQTITPGSASVEGLAIVSNGGTTTDAFDVSQNGWNSIKVNGYGQVYLSHGPSVDTLNIDSSQAGTALNFESAKDHITSSVANNDISGQIAVSSATSAGYTFARAYGSAPVCVLTPTSNPGSLTWWVTATTTAVTANLSASGTLTFNYHCFGSPN